MKKRITVITKTHQKFTTFVDEKDLFNFDNFDFDKTFTMQGDKNFYINSGQIESITVEDWPTPND